MGGDFLTADFGDGFDLAIVGNVAHNLGEAGTRALLGRVRERLVPGGRVAVKDLVVADDRLAPEAAVRFGICMALFTDAGGVFPASEVAGWLAAEGFEVVAREELTVAAGSYLVVGRKA